MELFGPILGMTMIVVGFIILLASIGLLFYGWWDGYKSGSSASGSSAEGNAEAERS